ncbi:hypothetical protein KSF_015980 [Reticulibacter mediterranei]|uniref:TraD/TraG TraM recognition site domain-containing protein n=1 Tax=Reticulibacter mediterranei TaxID=2778369 RepID=A0A8J3IFH4_9CHLR|nr:type IV secretory system conjugative DNA transfer family protein [Reticulibacter mediterranei]GHO91550.1 hypothetical protein KSF_015980 [Reticulibacter mediterranei]
MSTEHRKNHNAGGHDSWWVVLCALFVVALCLTGLPALLIGFVAQRTISSRLHWRLSFFLWFLLLLPSAFLLYQHYQHGLQGMLTKVFTDYILAVEHHQEDLAHWPIALLWAETWPLWLHTLIGTPFVGFWFEITSHMTSNTTKQLVQQEHRREHAIARAQQQARKRTRQPEQVADVVGDAMVVGIPIKDVEQGSIPMRDPFWTRHKRFTFPLSALRLHSTILGTSGSGKTETVFRICYGARKAYKLQVIYLDAKGETKREEEQAEDNAARFVAAMTAAGAHNVKVFPSLHLDGWKGDVVALKNRLLSVIDLSESAYYGDVAANVVDLALSAPTTPRTSRHFLANLQFERLKAIYQNDPRQYQRVLNLDKKLLQQVEMRYQVFFRAMQGQLDGTLDYCNVDAAYLRVRGFVLRDEAPRLGRFLVADFMHYVAERRHPGTKTLFVIDEFGALHLREETSLLFEQARSFGGSLVIAAQGYSALGPEEYASRILDSCSTYILHACTNPMSIIERVGKKFRLETSWSEDEEGFPRKHLRTTRDWKIPSDAVIQQETGQAFWSYRGHTQQVQTIQVPLDTEQVREGWGEIRRQEELQRRREQQTQKKRNTTNADKKSLNDAASNPQQNTPSGNTQKSRNGSKTLPNKKQKPEQENIPTSSLALPLPKPTLLTTSTSTMPPTPDLDDDEPDQL